MSATPRAKNKLKSCREAINKKEWDKAQAAAQAVLEDEPDNYHANVFLGVASAGLAEYEQSEQAYSKAIEIDPKQSLAWQGLEKLYGETKDSCRKRLNVLTNLASLYAAVNDSIKTAEALQKIIDVRRDPDKGTQKELADALSLLLPESPYYPVLSTLPPPDPTNPMSTTTSFAQSAVHNSLPILEELICIYAKEEERIEREEIEKRRYRLNARRDQVERDIAQEILSASKLPHLYNEVINHPHTSDELRRATEAKLLHMKQRHLFTLPGQDKRMKAQLATELDELINGIVLLKVPNELAWNLFIESRDAEHIEDYDFSILKQYTVLFPSSPMTELVQAYFNYIGVPLGDENMEENPNESKLPDDAEMDYFNAIMEAFAKLKDSIFAHRIVAQLYEQDTDWENAIRLCENGLERVQRVEGEWGREKKLLRKAFNVILATSLVHHYPPKNHVRALQIVDGLLAEDPENVPSLMCRGFIHRYAEQWSEAGIVFEKVARLVPGDFDHGLRAKEEHAWCTLKCSQPEKAAEELQVVIHDLDRLEGREEDKARAWWRLGQCKWEMGDEHREEAFKQYYTALKCTSTFAPAFTSLGIYYVEFHSPPDPNRASKCFQRAFELDPREGYAAQKLAEGFADEGEWDLVEVVARRTIEGEGGLEGGPEGKAPHRYLPINAWAWKAVGAVEMNKRNYGAAIDALQTALRTDVDDYVSWLRLGEANSKAGRYAAAFKALERARELNPDDWIASYFIGDVQRQMGAYEEAIKAFELILASRPHECGVLHSIGQSYLELGQFELGTGFSARGETSFISAIRVTLELLDASSGFRRVAWKTMTDALFHLSTFSVYSDEAIVQEVVSSVVPLVTEHPGIGLTDILSFPLSVSDSENLPLSILQLAVAACDYRLSLGGHDDGATSAVHYDLGVALSAFARRVLDSLKRERAEQHAIAQFKHALRLDPMNDSFWNALGSATFNSQPRLSQHAYIRAIEIDHKNAVTWTNLGLFYLHHGDTQLANEAFYKARTLDPDCALAWVGQGLVATSDKQNSDSSSALFEHATGLTSAVLEADFGYAIRLFSKVNASSTAATKTPATSAAALLPAFFVLDRYCRQRPHDAAALHLFGLVCERVGHVELGAETISRAIAVLEAVYEETEDAAIERQFTIAHANVARLRLATGDCEGALRSYEVALGLLPEGPEEQQDETDPDSDELRVLLAQCQFGSGLAQLKLGQLQEALGLFQAALATSAENAVVRGHVVVLLAQTLWGIGTEEAKESAKSHLLQSIEYDPENLMAINTLAGMGILTNDDGLVDAALSELLSLPLDQRHERDPKREVTYLLVQHHLGQGTTQQALAEAQKAVFVEPERNDARRTLSSLALQSGRGIAAIAVLGGAAGEAAYADDYAKLRASLALNAIALCAETGQTGKEAVAKAQRLAQKGVMISPWDKRCWEALAYARSRGIS